MHSAASRQLTLRWPDFFIVGAPRSGTSTLHAWLQGHPSVFMSQIKEPRFFVHVDSVIQRRFHITDQAEYLGLFQDAKSHQILGEATPSYLWRPESPGLIKEKVPNAKIIALLRQPIDRAYSAYWFMVNRGEECRSFGDAVLAEVNGDQEDILYIEPGMYAQQIGRYIEAFGRANVHVSLYEDFSNPMELMRRICSFLEVPFIDGSFFNPDAKVNTYAYKSWMKHVQQASSRLGLWSLARHYAPEWLKHRIVISVNRANHGAKKPEMDSNVRSFLADLYQEDILALQELLNIDLRSWQESGPLNRPAGKG